MIVTANTARRAEPDTPGTVDDAGVRALVDAAVEAGARRFVHVSADVARLDSPHEFLRAKAAGELHLSESGLAWTDSRAGHVHGVLGSRQSCWNRPRPGTR